VYRSTMLGGAHLVVFLFFDIFLFDFMRNTDIELFSIFVVLTRVMYTIHSWD
jgi:hypothetical protein